MWLTDLQKIPINLEMKKMGIAMSDHRPLEIMEKAGHIESLPQEILIDIFLQLPVEYLHNTVRYVCKSWWEIIHNPSFIDRQVVYSKSSLVYQDIYSQEDESSFNTMSLEINRGSASVVSVLSECPRFFKGIPIIKASCNGLILILFQNQGEFFVDEVVLIVANPITKQ